MPFTKIESARRAAGYTLVGGIDEVGRGAWAGPLVAAVVILKPYARLPDLKDSKQLTALQRKKYVLKIARGATAYRWGMVSAQEIDTIGIAEANRLAFRRAIAALAPKPDYVLADYFSLDGCACPVEGIKGGDERIRVVAAASVLAKVCRDEMMNLAERHYPGYGFAEHKGYGTSAHRRAIKKYGLSSWHRQSFQLV